MTKWLIFLAVLLVPVIASASTYSGYRWRSANNLIVYDTTYSARWTEAVRNAVAVWDSPYSQFEIRRVSECPRKFKVCVDEFNSEIPPYYFFARIVVRNGIIQRATVVLNDYDVDFTKDQAIFDRTMCHEIGHVLGLSPSADPDSCMSAGVPHPSAADFAQLEAIYGH